MSLQERNARRHAFLPVLLLLTAALAAGCAPPANRVILVIEASGIDPAAQMDRIVFFITASATTSGTELCVPLVLSIPLVEDATTVAEPTPIALPLSIALEPGERFNKLLIVRVEGQRLDGTVVFRHERLASFTGGEVRLNVVITAECLNRGTGPGEFCHNGEVYESAHWRIFDEGAYVQSGVLCYQPEPQASPAQGDGT